MRDDGAVVYLNGVEVHRANMPGGAVSFTTAASTALGGADESTFFETALSPSALVEGTNVLAVESISRVPPARTSASTSSWSRATPSASRAVPICSSGHPTRGRALAHVGAHRQPRRLCPTLADLDVEVYDAAPTTDHVVKLDGLVPASRYYYAVGTGAEILAGGNSQHSFVTAPPAGTRQPIRVWVIGDSGPRNVNAAQVRDAFLSWNGTHPIDLWLMLGDNAYQDGTDAEYQTAVFNMYPSVLRSSVLWPTLGNHDGRTADSATQTGPYYDIFTLPRAAEAGGVASGTEAYYSFDWGNVHFVVLDSFESDRVPPSPMLDWLEDDLLATTADWIVAYFHHPPYTHGSHNSDNDIESRDLRQHTLPRLEAHRCRSRAHRPQPLLRAQLLHRRALRPLLHFQHARASDQRR